MNLHRVVACACFSLATVVVAAPGELWSSRHAVFDDADATAAARSQAFLYRAFQLDTTALRESLRAAPSEPSRGIRAFANGQAHTTLDIPMPDGSTQKFAVVETPCMEPELAARFPNVRAYAGESLELPGTTVRCTLTSRGFHALVLSPSGTVVVNPASSLPTDRTPTYISFRQEDAADSGTQFDCTVLGEDEKPPVDRAAASTPLRGTYRNDLIVAYLPTAEWTILHGNSVETAISAMAELTTRLNAIYEKELCVRFIISAQQDKLIQFNPATDDLTNSSSSSMLEEAAGVYNRLTPTLYSQMRHVLGTYGGGVAYLYSSCSSQAAVTSSALPIENVYTVMVVAHEMGHQFSAPHTFSGRGERCNGNAGDCIEPGGGSTIMSYAQQCYPDNIVQQSELQFHAYSILGMSFRADCGTTVPLDNTPPSIAFPSNLVLYAPVRTPLILPSTLTDAEGDEITMSWDEIDRGASQTSLSQGDIGNNAIFRTFLPASDSTRVLPKWGTILNGDVSPGETMPTRIRPALKFRAFARDNRPGGGGTSIQDLSITIAPSSNVNSPFAVLSPQDGLARSGGPLLVTWAVVGTNVGSYRLTDVQISLMQSDDDRNPIVLVASTPNDGSELVNLPDLSIARARIIVRPINGIFFDVSRKPFEIIPRTSGPSLHFAGPARIADNFANGNSNGRIDSGESRIRIFIPAVNAGSADALGSLGELASHTPTARVVVSSATWPDLIPGAGAENSTPFVLEISPDHPCGTPIDLECTLLSATGSGPIRASQLAFQLPVGDSTLKAMSTFDYAGPPALIPDGDPAGVSVPLTIPSLPGPVTDVRLRFLGSVSIDPNRADAGINHPYVGDLVIRLTNPQGSTITVADRPGGVGNFGKNFCQTLFDMNQIVSFIQSAIPRRAPYDGVFFPKENLNLLTSDSGAGDWILSVADMRAGQATEPAPTLPSALRKFRLELTCQLPPACVAPKAFCEGDLNLDGVVSDADFEVFVVAYNALLSNAGDLDGDTLTTDADFTLFAQAYDQLVCP